MTLILPRTLTSNPNPNPNLKTSPVSIFSLSLRVFALVASVLYYSQFSDAKVFCSNFRSMGPIIFKLHMETDLSIQERLSKKNCSKSLWKPPSHGRAGSFFGYNFSSIGTSILKMGMPSCVRILQSFAKKTYSKSLSFGFEI